MLQFIYGQWEFEQWKVTVWHLVQAPGELSEIWAWEVLSDGSVLQPQQENLLAPVCGEAAGWG